MDPYSQAGDEGRRTTERTSARALRLSVTFGDMPNDIERLTWSGTSYAMSGGNADAISAADHVAPPAGDDGVAQVLEHIPRSSRARHALSLRARQSRIIGSWRDPQAAYRVVLSLVVGVSATH